MNGLWRKHASGDAARLLAAADAQRDEHAGGAAVDQRRRLHVAEAGRERADVGGAQRPVRLDRPPRDAAIGHYPGAAGPRWFEQADGAGDAGINPRVDHLERALPDAAVEQTAGADHSADNPARPAGRSGSMTTSTSR